MKYFYDCEFLEGTQTKRFLGIPYAKTKPTIDLISIGVVAEDGRELYLISKEFNLREAWDRYDLKKEYPDDTEEGAVSRKVYWIRENVLKPIFEELCKQDRTYDDGFFVLKVIDNFTYKNLKYLINKYGYTNAEIAEKVKEFVYNQTNEDKYYNELSSKPELYGYYSAYDHVVLCWLFGKMIDLPKGFPMYTIDVKQMLDEKIKFLQLFYIGGMISAEKDRLCSFEEKLDKVKALPNYPKQTNKHNSLSDARWNKELYNFIKSL